MGLSLSSLQAQRHTATRLGHPETRFAKPLLKSTDLRILLTSETLKADVASILNQAGWKGDLADLRQAAATTPIREWRIPVGARLDYMSSRRNGKPIVLWDVLWAGSEPIDAFAFDFSSRGRRYRCVTPKACSNFWVEDLGPDTPPPPRIALAMTAPAEARICDPIEMRLKVRNPGAVPLSQVRVINALPAALRGPEGQSSLVFEAGQLQPGESKEFSFEVSATSLGPLENTAQAIAAEGVSAEARAQLVVRQPVLVINCQAPEEVFAGRPIEVCLSIKNQGDAPEHKVIATLNLPPGAQIGTVSEGGTASATRVIWELGELKADESRQACATFALAEPGSAPLNPSARGACAEAVEVLCGTQVIGIPAILLEVIDLDDPIEVGSDQTYEIKVINQGSAPATNIKFVCRIESTQEFVSGTGPTSVKAEEGVIMIEPLPLLAPKAETTWRVVVRALAAGDVRFAIDLTSDQVDRPVQETEATQQY